MDLDVSNNLNFKQRHCNFLLTIFFLEKPGPFKAREDMSSGPGYLTTGGSYHLRIKPPGQETGAFPQHPQNNSVLVEDTAFISTSMETPSSSQSHPLKRANEEVVWKTLENTGEISEHDWSFLLLEPARLSLCPLPDRCPSALGRLQHHCHRTVSLIQRRLKFIRWHGRC